MRRQVWVMERAWGLFRKSKRKWSPTRMTGRTKADVQVELDETKGDDTGWIYRITKYEAVR